MVSAAELSLKRSLAWACFDNYFATTDAQLLAIESRLWRAKNTSRMYTADNIARKIRSTDHYKAENDALAEAKETLTAVRVTLQDIRSTYDPRNYHVDRKGHPNICNFRFGTRTVRIWEDLKGARGMLKAVEKLLTDLEERTANLVLPGWV
jgi:hypothetical protein